ncbi:MAG: YdcF family protein, partial [Nevskiales bacterium]
MIWLHKILPLLVAPLFLFGLVIVLCLILRRWRWLGVGALATLWVVSLPLVADKLWVQLERPWAPISASTVPVVEAIVVLSGMSTRMHVSDTQVLEWGTAVDRLFAGISLYRAGRAPRLVFTGGHHPWSIGSGTEGDDLKAQAVAFGVPENAILVTGPVQNTWDEAVAISERKDLQRVVLVTSAFHMTRASSLFAQQGVEVIPYPVDFRVGQRPVNPSDLLPNAEALQRSS